MELSYTVKRSKRKTVCLTFDAQQRVLVRAPLWMPAEAIERFVHGHREWIEKHRQRLHLAAQNKTVFRYLDGESVYIFGRRTVLCTGKAAALQPDGRLALPANERAQELEKFLRTTAAKVIPERVSFFAQQMGAVPAGVRITGAKTRWGSCSGKNRLCFSWRCAALPPELLDYIVVHELAHIRQHNHSSLFYAEVAAILPHYRQLEQALRDFHARLPY